MFNNYNSNFSRPLPVDEFVTFDLHNKPDGQKVAISELETQEPVEKPTLTRKEAMTELGISESTIICWGKRGFLRMTKLGHKCLYFQADIDWLLRNGTDSVRP